MAGFPKFNVNESSGKPIAGNSNAGHEGDQYGTNLSPDRADSSSSISSRFDRTKGRVNHFNSIVTFSILPVNLNGTS